MIDEMDSTSGVIVMPATGAQLLRDLAGNPITVQFAERTAIVRGNGFLSRFDLASDWHGKGLDLKVVQSEGKEGAFDVLAGANVVVRSVSKETGEAVLDQVLSHLVASEQGHAFDLRRKRSGDVIGFVLVGLGLAVFALPVIGMGRLGWDVAVKASRMMGIGL